MTVTLAHVQAAARAIADDIRPTPTVDSPGLSALLDAQVVLKLENRQFTGAFKERGALNRLLALDETERRRGVVAVSAGPALGGVYLKPPSLGWWRGRRATMPRGCPTMPGAWEFPPAS